VKKNKIGSGIVSVLAAMALIGTSAVLPAQAATKDITIGATLDMDKYDPHTATGFGTGRVLGLAYGSLVELGPKLDIRAGLARSWGFNAAGTQLRMTLRKGVKFHDGSTFDATDVKASLERILDPNTKAAARSNITTIKSITIVNPYQITLDLTQANVPILAALDGFNMSMVSSDDIASGKVGKVVNGTGPFKFLSWEPGQTIKLTKNATYWGGAPKVDNVTFRIIPNEASILAALNSGAINFAVITSPDVAKQVGSNLTMLKVPALAYMALQINARVAPYDKLGVRLALQCAIDRSEVLKTASGGQGTVVGPITSPAYKSTQMLVHAQPQISPRLRSTWLMLDIPMDSPSRRWLLQLSLHKHPELDRASRHNLQKLESPWSLISSTIPHSCLAGWLPTLVLPSLITVVVSIRTPCTPATSLQLVT